MDTFGTVFNNSEVSSPRTVDYSKIVPVLIKAVQELKIELDSMKAADHE